jgi:hypothetical protein
MPLAGDIIYPNDMPVIIARGNRPTDKVLATTGETGIMRVDNVPLKAGHAYSIRAPHVRYDSVTATDLGMFRIRQELGGAAATTSSAILRRCETTDAKSHYIEALRFPSVDETASFLLSCNKIGGTGAWTAMCSDEGGCDLLITDLGATVADTGVDI